MVTNNFNNLGDIALSKAEIFSLDITEESATRLSIEQIIDEDYILNGFAKNAIGVTAHLIKMIRDAYDKK